eukprot:4722659-Prymnesium_polylepis.3
MGTMGMGQLGGGVECATQHFVCPVVMHPVRRARVRAKRARIFEFTNCAIREYSHESELHPVAKAAWNVHHTCPTPRGVWGSAWWRWGDPWDIATAARCAAHAFRAHS